MNTFFSQLRKSHPAEFSGHGRVGVRMGKPKISEEAFGIGGRRYPYFRGKKENSPTGKRSKRQGKRGQSPGSGTGEKGF